MGGILIPVGWNSIDLPQNLVFILASCQKMKLRDSAWHTLTGGWWETYFTNVNHFYFGNDLGILVRQWSGTLYPLECTRKSLQGWGWRVCWQPGSKMIHSWTQQKQQCWPFARTDHPARLLYPAAHCIPTPHTFSVKVLILLLHSWICTFCTDLQHI